MKCKEMTTKIDLHEFPTSLPGKIDFWFHLAICGACKNYLRFSQSLATAIRSYRKALFTNADVERIGKALLEKFARN